MQSLLALFDGLTKNLSDAVAGNGKALATDNAATTTA
jgi:hypothetical protein